MKWTALYQRITTGILKKEQYNKGLQETSLGVITYTALLVMFSLLASSIVLMRLTSISLSNTKDEMRLLEAHYDAERGARWFVAYCKHGGRWDFGAPLVVEHTPDTDVYIKADPQLSTPRHVMSYGIRNGVTARVHIYVREDEVHTLHVVQIKPY